MKTSHLKKNACSGKESILTPVLKFSLALAALSLSSFLYAHELFVPKPSSIAMDDAHEVLLHDRCFLMDGELRPAGCTLVKEEALAVRGVVGDTARLHQLDFPKGALSPLHNHADEEIFYILKGEFRVTSGEEVFMLSQGDVIIFPAFIPHQFEALVESSLLETGGPGPMLGIIKADEPNTQ